MIEPPNPGLPVSTLYRINELTWRDGRLVDGAGLASYLAVDNGQWVIAIDGTYQITAATYARLRGATLTTSGVLTSAYGVAFILDRVRLPDGTQLAVACPTRL